MYSTKYSTFQKMSEIIIKMHVQNYYTNTATEGIISKNNS